MLDGESFQTRILKQLQGFGEIAISRRKVNEENAEDIPYPVSYTHLDVYKRQHPQQAGTVYI